MIQCSGKHAGGNGCGRINSDFVSSFPSLNFLKSRINSIAGFNKSCHCWRRYMLSQVDAKSLASFLEKFILLLFIYLFIYLFICLFKYSFSFLITKVKIKLASFFSYLDFSDGNTYQEPEDPLQNDLIFYCFKVSTDEVLL